jgi:pimeloyl-ACP methyl ester carboxylesterase
MDTTITSADGTTIGVTQAGRGPALVLVDGAMCYRAAGPLAALAARLVDHFTVYTYDRRGRGASGDTLPYAVEKEVDDLRAVLEFAGGSAFAYGISSGGALVLRSVAAGLDWSRIALYEVPYLGDKTEYSRELRERLATGGAVEFFMTNVGVPAEAIAGMQASPAWPVFEAIAPTLGYDDQVLGDGRVPRDDTAAVKVPTLVLDGGASPASLRDAAAALAAAIPQAEHRTLPEQTHDVAPDSLAPELIRFFG